MKCSIVRGSLSWGLCEVQYCNHMEELGCPGPEGNFGQLRLHLGEGNNNSDLFVFAQRPAEEEKRRAREVCSKQWWFLMGDLCDDMQEIEASKSPLA